MKIFVVTQVVDTGTGPETRAVTSAHVSEQQAQEFAAYGTGGVAETVELDLTRLTGEHLRELVASLPAGELQQLRDVVIRRQAQLARGRRS